MLFPTGASIDWRSKSPIVPPLNAREFSFLSLALSVEALVRLRLTSHLSLSRHVQLVRQSGTNIPINKTRTGGGQTEMKIYWDSVLVCTPNSLYRFHLARPKNMLNEVLIKRLV